MIEKQSLKALLFFGVLVISVVSAFAVEGRVDVNAGQIKDDYDAIQKCEDARVAYLKRNPNYEQARWTGQWRATEVSSVCGIRYISRKDWQDKSIDYRTISKDDLIKNCTNKLNITNGWINDDKCRDRLDMTYSNLNYVIEVDNKEKIAKAADSRYIFVLRKNDNKLILRRYDRSHSGNANYAKCNYDNFIYSKNKKNIGGTKNLHVRHSQLNGLNGETDAWNSVWSAGELWIEGGKIIAISNESGHFKPPFESLKYVKETLSYLSIPIEKIDTYNAPDGARALNALKDKCLGGKREELQIWDPWD